MNNSLDDTLIQDYLEELPLDPQRQEELAHRLEEGGDLATLHHALQMPEAASSEPQEETRELLESVPARLEMGWPDALERGCRLVEDHQAGRPSSRPCRSGARASCRSPGRPTSSTVAGDA